MTIDLKVYTARIVIIKSTQFGTSTVEGFFVFNASVTTRGRGAGERKSGVVAGQTPVPHCAGERAASVFLFRPLPASHPRTLFAAAAAVVSEKRLSRALCVFIIPSFSRAAELRRAER